MPTIYTEDKVGKAIEDHYIGTQGVYTGSAANSIGYAEHQRRNAQSTSTPVSSPSTGGSYELFPFIQNWIDSIPRMVFAILAACCAVAAVVIAFQTNELNVAYFTSLSASGGQWLGLAFVTAVGWSIGWFIIPLLLVLVDLGLKLLYIAAVIAAVLGVGWVVVSFLQ